MKRENALIDLLRPLDFAIEGYMARTGLLQRAFFENLFVRHVRRTDDENMAPNRLMTNIPIGSVAYASLGTSAVHVAGSLYVSEIFIPFTKRLTGIGFLNGATVGTDNLLVALFDAKGVRLAHSAVAGALSAGANAFQEIAFTAPYQLPTDGKYHIAIQCNGTTATTRRIAASTFLNRASIIAGTFGTVPGAITVPTTITATAGPIGYVY